MIPDILGSLHRIDGDRLEVVTALNAEPMPLIPSEPISMSLMVFGIRISFRVLQETNADASTVVTGSSLYVVGMVMVVSVPIP